MSSKTTVDLNSQLEQTTEPLKTSNSKQLIYPYLTFAYFIMTFFRDKSTSQKT